MASLIVAMMFCITFPLILGSRARRHVFSETELLQFARGSFVLEAGDTEKKNKENSSDLEGSHRNETVPDEAKQQVEGKKYEIWGDTCWGYWDPWGPCSDQCFKEKTFTLKENKCNNPAPIFDQEIAYKLCTGGACPLKVGDGDNNFFLRNLRESAFLHGLHSGLLNLLGEVMSNMQLLAVCMMLLVVLSICVANSFKRDWLPDITVAIPAAALVALVVRYGAFGGVHFGMAANNIVGFATAQLMNTVLIPISIFEGAYHIQRRNFFSQFAYGIIFAVFGTLISALLIAPMVVYTGQWGMHPVTSWREAFAYAAFIADTDPVATLSVFSNLKVDALLSTLVAGEATLNDPIALVIFGICNEKAASIDINWGAQIRGGIFLLVGSIVLGLVAGIVLSAMIPIFRVRRRGALETAYIFISAYLCFALGEYVGLSGIIVVLFGGLMMGVYAHELLDDNASVDTTLFNAARAADMVMFIIIGFSFFLADSMEGFKLGLLTIVFCFVSRAIMIAMLVPLVNLIKRYRGYEMINFGRTFMMFHSGLRGGMTMMMALMVDPYWSKNQNTLVVATVTCVTGMSYLCGCSGPYFLNLMGVPVGVDQEDGSLFDEDSGASSFLGAADTWISFVVMAGAPTKKQNSERTLASSSSSLTDQGGM